MGRRRGRVYGHGGYDGYGYGGGYGYRSRGSDIGDGYRGRGSNRRGSNLHSAANEYTCQAITPHGRGVPQQQPPESHMRYTEVQKDPSEERGGSSKMPSVTDINEMQTEADKVYEAGDIGGATLSDLQKSENPVFEIPSKVPAFFDDDAAGIEVVSAEGIQPITTTEEMITSSTQDNNELEQGQIIRSSRTVSLSSDTRDGINEAYCGDEIHQLNDGDERVEDAAAGRRRYSFSQRSPTSLSVRSEMCGISKPYRSNTKDARKDPARGSCFELCRDCYGTNNRNAAEPRIVAASQEDLRAEANPCLSRARSLSLSGQKLSSKKNSCIELHQDLYGLNVMSGQEDAQKLMASSKESLHSRSCCEISDADSLEISSKKAISSSKVHNGAGQFDAEFHSGTNSVASEHRSKETSVSSCGCKDANQRPEECLNTAFFGDSTHEYTGVEEQPPSHSHIEIIRKQFDMVNAVKVESLHSQQVEKLISGAHRASCDCLHAAGDAPVESHGARQKRSVSVSAKYYTSGPITSTNGDSAIVSDVEKTASVSGKDVTAPPGSRPLSKCSQHSQVSFASIPLLCEPFDNLPSDSELEVLRPVSEHRKTPLRGSRELLSTGDRTRTSSVHSNRSFNDSVPWGDVIPTTELRTPSPRNRGNPSEEVVAKFIAMKSGTPTTYMMRPDTDYTPRSGFNQTQISREQYIKMKPDFEQKPKELSKSESNKRTFITQHTIIYPASRLEMQRYPNGFYQYKYEDENDLKNVSAQTDSAPKDQSTQTKEQIVTQSPEDTSRAVSVLNIMLQRRLNNSGSQNGSFAQDRMNSIYSTPPEGPQSPSVRILSFENSAKNTQPSDFADRNDAALPQAKDLHLPSETEMRIESVTKRHFECVVQEPKEKFLKRYYYDKYDELEEKMSRKSSTDGRSTIRDRLPRGQTRKLASLFETMSDAARTEMLQEMDHLKRRGKSVPSRNAGKTNRLQSEVKIKKLVRDDLNLYRGSNEPPSVGGRDAINIGFAVAYKNTEGELFGNNEQVVEASSVRNIVNRFESVATPNKYENAVRYVQIDSTPRRAVVQKRYSQYDVDMSKPAMDAANYKSLQNVQYMVEPNRAAYGTTKPASVHSEEHDVRSGGHLSPSYNVPYDSAGYVSVWDRQQYELGLRKGITDLKRYDSSYRRMQKEISDRDDPHTFQAQTHQMDYRLESPTGYHHKDLVPDRSRQHYYEERMDPEIVDHVAEVEKAFDFVNKTESITTAGPLCSQESLGKPSLSSVKANYSMSLYRDLERERRNSPSPDVPIRFSPATCSPPPSAGERVAAYEHGNAEVQCSRHESQVVTTDPVATSTPLDGSPATHNRLHTSASHVLNRSGISTITASTAHEMTHSQQLEIKLQAMKESIMIQEDQIAQASLALVHCKKSSSFNGTLVELSAQRGLLLARERLLALQNEMQRLKTLQLVKKPLPPLAKRMRGAIDLTSINVYLNRNFCIRNTDENISYAFVILLKTDEQVEATQTVTLMDTRALRVSKVHFTDQIRFTNLPVDFTVLLEIYALKVSECRRSDDYSCSMLKNKAKSLLSPSKKTGGNESIVSSSEFTCCGHICLNRDTVGMQKFYLDEAVYPLEGTIEIDSRCTTLPPVIEIDFRGFLTMYQVVAGLGSWARYWAVLRRGVVQFWKYPDDEASEKPALACMDLSKCTDRKIGHASHEICSRPNAFTVDLLVPTSPSLIEKKRVLLSADTKELCNAWLNALNETLEVLRGEL